MTLAALAVAGFILAWLAGASFRRLADIHLRGSWLVVAALTLQLLVFGFPVTTKLLAPAAVPAHITSYVLLVLFALLNLAQPGFTMAAVGLALNVAAISANHGRMPVLLSVWSATGRAPIELAGSGHYNNTTLAATDTHLGFLGDVFPLPASVPLANALSVGDILLLLGATYFVYRRCCARPRISVMQLRRRFGSTR